MELSLSLSLVFSLSLSSLSSLSLLSLLSLSLFLSLSGVDEGCDVSDGDERSPHDLDERCVLCVVYCMLRACACVAVHVRARECP